MSEASILARVRIALSQAGAVVFRNQVGALRDKQDRLVRFGVGPANGGGSDLIGYLSVLVTPDMVGVRVAIFLAAEVKAPDGIATTAQKHFLETVRAAGGVGMLVRSDTEALAALSSTMAAVASGQ